MALQNNKSLGQHWLKNREILDEIADLALGNAPEDPSEAPETPLCLEIGPGLGTLTSSLLRRFPRVVAVEFDEKLAQNLPKSFPGKDLTVIQGNFLDFDLTSVKEPYIVVGNIPYYITSPLITKVITSENPPQRVVFLIQKEVAERVAAAPGNHSALSLLVQNYADVTLGPVVKKDLFTPPPKVDSQVIILTPHITIVSESTLKFIHRSFSSPRKKLIKNLPLAKEPLLEAFNQLGISPDARPSDLALDDWQALAKICHNH